jgi:hypothetical protein
MYYFVVCPARNAIDTWTSKALYICIPQIGILGLKICCHVGSVNPESEFSGAQLCIVLFLVLRNAIDTWISQAPYILIPQIGILGLKICCHVGSVNPESEFSSAPFLYFSCIFGAQCNRNGVPGGLIGAP